MIGLVGRRPALRTSRVLAGLALMVAIAVWWHLDGAGRVGAHSDGATLQWLPAYLGWFALGLLLALAQVHLEAGRSGFARPFVALARQPGSCWVAAAGLMLVAATPLAGPSMLAAPTPAQSLTKNALYAGVGFLVVLTGVFADPRGRYGVLASRAWGRRLGWISYGVFCLHLPVLHLVMWTTGWPLFQGRGFAIWGLALLISLVAAELVYRLVERPALRLKRLGRPKGSPDVISSAPTSGTSIT
jgi:peptidoglycan/LPS O-acetylase OafA/YrhL